MKLIDIKPLGHPVRVLVDGEVVAETDRALLLDETGLPGRIYVPREDVRQELVTPGDKRTHCPWKGHASYWTVAGAENAAWSYEAPKQKVAEIAGHLSFAGASVVIQRR